MCPLPCSVVEYGRQEEQTRHQRTWTEIPVSDVLKEQENVTHHEWIVSSRVFSPEKKLRNYKSVELGIDRKLFDERVKEVLVLVNVRRRRRCVTFLLGVFE